MSQRDPKLPYLHMLQFAEKAIALTSGITRDQFFANEVLLLAAARLLEMIGEAGNRVPRSGRPEISGIPWRQIIGLRNLLIHAYDRVDPQLMWDIINRDLPELVKALRELDLTTESGEGDSCHAQ